MNLEETGERKRTEERKRRERKVGIRGNLAATRWGANAHAY